MALWSIQRCLPAYSFKSTQHPLEGVFLCHHQGLALFTLFSILCPSTTLTLQLDSPRALSRTSSGIALTTNTHSDLRGIRIPRADISGGQFDSARLEDSDFTGVNFAKAWVRCTDFSRAQMEGVRFGELPWLKEDEEIYSCTVSPDGKTLAAGLGNGDISIYDTATWVKAQSLHGHEKSVSSLAFSPSGFQLLSGSEDKTVRLWKRETGLIDCILEGHTRQVLAVAFSPSGKQVASASRDKTVRLWDAQTGATLFVLKGHGGDLRVASIAYSPDGTNIVSCSRLIDDRISCNSKIGAVRMFDTRNGKLLQRSSRSDVVYRCIAYSPGGRRVILGDLFGQLQLWKTNVIELDIEWNGHSNAVSSVQFSPNGQCVLSSSQDCTVKLWKAQSGALIHTFAGHTSRVTSAIVLPTTGHVISSSWDRAVRCWEASPTGVDPAADDTTNIRQIAAYSPDGRSLISEVHPGLLQQYDAVTGELGLALRPHNRFSCATYSSNGLQIATASLGGEVRLWNAQSYAVEHVIQTGHAVSIVVYSPCGRWIALAMKHRGVEVWDTRSENSRHTDPISYDMVSLVFSSNGLNLAVGYRNGDIRVWETSTWSYKMFIEADNRRSAYVVYQPNSSHLACRYASDAEGIRLFDDSGKTFRTILEQAKFKFHQFAYSSCGQWIAAVDGKKVHIWKNTSDGIKSDWAHATTVKGFFGKVRKATWRLNRTEFATVSEDGSIRAWKVEESGLMSVQLLWSYGGTTFTASGAILFGAVRLSTTNRKLLMQRGAIFESSLSDNNSSDDYYGRLSSEKDLTSPVKQALSD